MRILMTAQSKKNSVHHGIIICMRDDDVDALAQRIDQAIVNLPGLDNLLIRVNRPSVP